MDIRFIKGDITTASHGIIVHGCNLQNTMGSGVAKAISDTWPEVKEAYHKAFDLVYPTDVIPALGQVQYVRINGSLTVANAFTQEKYGNNGRYADLDAIEKALRTVCSLLMIKGSEVKRLHMPKIGGKRGGLDFAKEVMPVVEQIAASHPAITFAIWEYEDGD